MNDQASANDDVSLTGAPGIERFAPDLALGPTALAGANETPPGLLKRQQAVVAMGRRAVASPETSILLQDAAALIAEMLEVEAFGVAELTNNNASLDLQLTIKQPDRIDSRTVRQALDVLGDQSLAAYALRVAHPVVSADFCLEERFQDLFLRKLGLRSALAAPLKLQDRAFGALVACSATSQRFTAQDAMFAETIGHLAATAVARSYAEKTPAEEQSFALGMLQVVGALVLVLNAEGRAVRINRVCEQVTGFSLADLSERPIWNVFPKSGEAELYHANFEKVRRGAPRVEYESFLLTKHYQQRRIRWSFGALPNVNGAVESILATGIDITEQVEANERAQRAEEAAQRAEQAAEQARKAAGLIPEATPDSQETAAPSEDSGQAASPAAQGVSGPLDKTLRERRRRQRRAFPYCQSIAPVLNGSLPKKEEFRHVECHNITAGGFAYVSEKPPESKQLVIALGSPPQLTYLIAQVVHTTPTTHNGKPAYLIGCSYTGRAPY